MTCSTTSSIDLGEATPSRRGWTRTTTARCAWRSWVGPNVGKSTLFNQLIGEERSVVHDMPGTTRDAIDTVVDTERRPDPLHRHRGHATRARTEAGLETYSVLRSLDALDRADIAILVIDATDGATGQDQRLAERIAAAGCPRSSCSTSGSSRAR